MKMKCLFYMLICLLALFESRFVKASFANRNANSQNVPNSEANSAQTTKANPSAKQNNEELPPQSVDYEYSVVSYENAENELLRILFNDLKSIEKSLNQVAVVEVNLNGRFPRGYKKTFRNKIERILLNSEKISIKECPQCDESRLVRSESGELRFESNTQGTDQRMKLAAVSGANQLLKVDLTLSNEDLTLRLRAVDAQSNNLVFTKDYSVAEATDAKAHSISVNGFDGEVVGDGDALSKAVIGEIGFTFVLSPGLTMLPTIDNGRGSSLGSYPSVDLLIGERFDKSHKRFGFAFGVATNFGASPDVGTALPLLIHFGPQFRYTVNPMTIKSPRFSMFGEVGAALCPGMATGYFKAGPELNMIQRFSVSLAPMYILPAKAFGTASTTIDENTGQTTQKDAPELGKFGGLALAMNVSINW